MFFCRHRKYRLYFLLLSLSTLTAVADADKSAVWKVSKGEDYLYLGGTIHLLPESAFPLPSGYDKAFADSDVVVLETELPDTEQEQQQLLQGLMFHDGQTLDQLLSADTYQRLARYFSGQQVKLADYNGFTPGFILMLATQLEMSGLGMNGEGVDAYYQQQAEQQNKPLWFLETIQFQVSVLAGLGRSYEDEFVRNMLDEIPEAGQMLNDTLTAWRSADLDLINDLINQPTKDDDPQTFKTLFVQRNYNWLKQIDGYFTNHERELLLVGIGHLAGKEGLISLLTEQGYQIEQLSSH